MTTLGTDDLSVYLRTLSDVELDTFYGETVGQQQTLAGLEILDRINSAWGMVKYAFGNPFANFTAKGTARFDPQESAIQAVSDNATKVVKSLAVGTWSIALPLLIIAVIIWLASRKIAP